VAGETHQQVSAYDEPFDLNEQGHAMSTGSPTGRGNFLIRWNPAEGPETRALLDSQANLSPAGKQQLLAEGQAVLRKCVPPTSPADTDTGIAIGFVQSGKTLNFTTVAALARDNAYPLVIVIAGTSVPLFRQSTNRLIRDLGISSRRGARRWRHVANPSMDELDTIRSVLDSWQAGSVVPVGRRQSVLVTVMKQYQHLDNLNDVLQELDLAGIPTLVIDDEADQAGLNNEVLQQTQSTTYGRLLNLKARLPHHTYLQYTATPQAPLLINIIDALSPSFADILTPGPDYCGGGVFFVPNSPYVRTIPAADIPTPNRVLQRMPQSLVEAMRAFMVGVAYSIFMDDTSDNRSMLVHPSRTTGDHADYVQWITRLKRRWELTLDPATGDPNDRQDLLNQFRIAYDDLAATVPNLATDAPFDDIADCLLEAVRSTEITEMNTRRDGTTPEVNWDNSYAHILVGGQAMDRGFTVEGLTVTYMPRSLGVGNADSIQQRARFFGYKRSYLGFCRVYLEQRARRAFELYVDHEADMHRRLIEHRDQGLPLSQWRRAFFLAQGLNPTRRTLIDVPIVRGMNGDDWFFPRGPHASPAAIFDNRKVVADFLATLTMHPDTGHASRTVMQQHQLAENVPLRDVFEQLLLNYRVPRTNDSIRFYGALMQIRAWLDDNPNATCSVYHMRPGQHVPRGLSAAGDMRNLHQGPGRSGGVQTYPGDFHTKALTGVTVQIHNVEIHDASGTTLATDVPVLAVWIPNELSQPFLIQQQP
jgi:hypothetical protein